MRIAICIITIILCIAASSYTEPVNSRLICTQVPDAYNVNTSLDRWNTLPSAQLIPSKDFHPENISDLSGKVTLAWNSKYVFVIVCVVDNHFRPYDSISGFWNGDSIQFAFSPNSSTNSDAKYSIFLGVAEFPFGRKVAVTTAPHGLATGVFDIPFNTIHEGNTLTYISAVPWRYVLGVDPLSDNGFKFNAIINDNDGSGRRGWLQLSDGIGDGPDPSKFQIARFPNSRDTSPQIFTAVSELTADNDKTVDISIITRNILPGMKVRLSAGNYTNEKILDKQQILQTLKFTEKSESIGMTGDVPVRVDLIDKSGKVIAQSETLITIIDKTATANRIEQTRRILVEVDDLIKKAMDSGKNADYIQLRSNCLRYALKVADLIQPRLSANDEKTRNFERVNENIIKYMRTAGPKLKSDARELADGKASSLAMRKPVLSAPWTIRNGDIYAGSEPVMINGVVWMYGNRDSNFPLGKAGMNGQTIDIGPNSIIGNSYQIRNDLDSCDPVNFWRRVAREGYENNEVFDLHTSPHYLPPWFKPDNHYAWMNTPDGRRLLELTYQGLAKSLGDMKSIKTADLANEWTYWSTSPEALNGFRNWLKNNYGTIQKLNNNWGTDLKSFEEVPNPYPSVDSNTLDAPKGIYQPMNPEGIYKQRGPNWDWCRYNTSQAASTVEWLNTTFKKNFPDLYTQIKCILSSREYRTLADNYILGIDPEKIIQKTDLIGTDASYTRGVMWKGTLFSYDYMKSIAPNKPIICTEMHAPPYDEETAPGEIRRGLFQRFVHGERFNLIFLMVTTEVMDWWAQTFEGTNMNTWNIGSCPETLESMVVTSADIQRLAKEFNSFSKRKPDVLIYYDNAADFCVPQSENPQGRYCDRAMQVYESLIYRNIQTGFVTESMLASRIPDTPLIVLAGVEYISDEAIKSLQKYVEKGGVLLCLGDNFRYNHYGIQRSNWNMAQNKRMIKMPLQSNAAGYGKVWQTIFPIASIKSSFLTKGANRDIAWGVEIKSTKMANGKQLIFLANTNNTPVSFKLLQNNKIKTSYKDLITGAKIYGNKINMAVNQVMLLNEYTD
ncbi:MAG: beta-galactosidase [Armatimonadota bacterium]